LEGSVFLEQTASSVSFAGDRILLSVPSVAVKGRGPHPKWAFLKEVEVFYDLTILLQSG
jgi:hypothetical protein